MKEVHHRFPDRVNPDRVYVLYCSMHALNRALHVGVLEGLGPGGLECNSVLQFLHTVYSVPGLDRYCFCEPS